MADDRPMDAGAPETEISSQMIQAGEEAIFEFGVIPNLSTADWASDLAGQVFRAMERARSSKRD
jgi:hypothetical protein